MGNDLTKAKAIIIVTLDMAKKSVRHITDTLTAEVIQEGLGVGTHAVRFVRTTGEFPATWYRFIKAKCDEVGIPCPMTAFKFKGEFSDASADVEPAE